MPPALELSPAPAAPAPQWSALALAGAALLGLGALVSEHGPRMVALLGLGLLLGLTLYHATFGFASAYRRLIETGDTRAIRAQLVMLAVATLLFAPVLAQGSWFGRDVVGAVAPAGVPVAVGAFLFGIGMQLAGGCGSGTLFSAGAGQLRMLLTLAAFCAGSFWASLHMDLWDRLPAPGAIALGERFGWPLAVALQLVVIAVLFALLWRWRGREEVAEPSGTSVAARMLRGPWSLAAGALLLAGLNFLTLITAGHPWTITWAFTLWGAKTALLFGWDPQGEAFWSAGFQAYALDSSVFADVTSVMDFGIVLGAFAAAALAGRYRARYGPSARAALAALAGGIAMGYGARIAFGCNIGAFFSGVASTSLHGWLWILAALPGSWIGVRLRPWFGMR
jgi:uncharacterized protein